MTGATYSSTAVYVLTNNDATADLVPTFYLLFTSIGSKELVILSCVEDLAWRLLEAGVALLEPGNDVTLDEVKAYPNPACGVCKQNEMRMMYMLASV